MGVSEPKPLPCGHHVTLFADSAGNLAPCLQPPFDFGGPVGAGGGAAWCTWCGWIALSADRFEHLAAGTHTAGES